MKSFILSVSMLLVSIALAAPMPKQEVPAVQVRAGVVGERDSIEEAIVTWGDCTNC